MKTDTSLDDIFSRFNPDLGNDTIYMDTFAQKLDAVDCMKQCTKHQIRAYRYAVAGALLLGMLLGGTSVWYVLSLPVETFDIGIHISACPSEFSGQHLRIIVLALISALMTIGIVNLIGTIQDLLTDTRSRWQVMNCKAV
ncbi:MAG: hypothetical protein Q4E55_02840 [Bacteroidales bacterium]|nr:hypothetical protein [Bacteroidales bacterium]